MPLLLPLAAVVVFQFADYASFLVMVARHGLEAEVNPLVVAVAQQLGLPGLTLFKLAGLVIAASSIAVLAPRRRLLATTLTVVAVGTGLVGAASNLASL